MTTIETPTKSSEGTPPGVNVTQESSTQPKTRRRLSVSVINFWIDASLLVVLSMLGWVSATLQVVFPAPTLAAGWKLWGLTFDQWRDVQFGILCLFGLGVLLHLMMHWNWVCSVISTQILHSLERPDEGMQTIFGVITLIVGLHVIAAGVIAAMFCVVRPPQ